jgi:hypothetical protein
MSDVFDLEIRFWKKVDKEKSNIFYNGTRCWEWIAGTRGDTGYGCIKYNGKVIDSHRMSWFITYGYFPSNLVCHHCDNRLCCNPEHLFTGSYSDNRRDCISKGRDNGKKGSEHPLYKEIIHGNSRSGYDKGCRCELCRKSKNESMKRYREYKK